MAEDWSGVVPFRASGRPHYDGLGAPRHQIEWVTKGSASKSGAMEDTKC